MCEYIYIYILYTHIRIHMHIIHTYIYDVNVISSIIYYTHIYMYTSHLVAAFFCRDVYCMFALGRVMEAYGGMRLPTDA